MMTQQTLPVKISLLETVRLVAKHLYNSFSILLEILKKPSTMTSRGRRKSDHFKDYNLMIKQIEAEGAGFLNTVDVELNYL